MSYDVLLQRLFQAARAPLDIDGVGAVVEFLAAVRAEERDDLVASLVASSRLDRPWLVHTVALQASIRRLLSDCGATPDDLGPSEVLCFCASEAGGNHPRAIETRLEEANAGEFSLRGVKRWATLAPVADRLLIIASTGRDEQRNHLRAVLVPGDATGLYVEDMTMPGGQTSSLHLPNGLVQIEDVAVAQSAVLPGDGYSCYLKPFRTLEDLFVNASTAAALLGMARRHAAPDAMIERIVGVLGSLHAASLKPHDASSQLMIGAAEAELHDQISDLATVLPDAAASWWRSIGDIQVAASAKARRRATALQRLDDPR